MYATKNATNEDFLEYFTSYGMQTESLCHGEMPNSLLAFTRFSRTLGNVEQWYTNAMNLLNDNIKTIEI